VKHDLFPHQLDAVRYAKSRDAIALFMEMRLGKSPVTIRWAQHHGLRRILLVAPLNTLRGRLQWEGELRRERQTVTSLPAIPKAKWMGALYRWRKGVGDAVIDDGFARPGDTTTALIRERRTGWFLANWEAVLHEPSLLQRSWDGIVLDESTRIRSPRAKITKLFLSHTAHVRHRAILSGLPNPETPLDYFCQFQFLDGHFMGYENYYEFRYRYFLEGFQGWDWYPKKGTRDAIRNYVHDRAFILQRKTAGVGSDKVREVIRIPQNKLQRRTLREASRDFAVGDRETKWATTVHLWMQKIAGGFHPTLEPVELLSEAKLRALCHVAKRHRPVVVWFRFNHEIEFAYQYLQQHSRLRVAYVHGEMKDSKTLRIKRQEQFQRGELDVILLQVKLGRYGWNLSRANTAVYYSNSFEFEDRSQSEDRIIHLTKRTPCLYIDLVTENSADEDVVETLAEKRMNARLFARRLNQMLRQRWQHAA
jgi:hypothetical protein